MTSASLNENDTELRVASKTPTQELASAISHALYDGKRLRLRAIGAGAVNQAVKGMIIASGYVSQRGLSLSFRPGFLNVRMEGETEDRTAIVFYVFTD